MKNKKPASNSPSAGRLVLALVCSIFFGEAVVMVALDHLPPFAPWDEALIDATSLVILVFPVLYFLVFRPMAMHIAERQRAELELRVAATAFESQEGMIITDADCVILRINQAFTDITGYTAEEAVGKKMHMLKSGRHDAAFYAAMWKSIADTGTWQGEIWNRRKNGEIYPEWLTITAVNDAAGKTSHYVGTLTDITARKSAEDEIRHLAFFDPLTRLPNRVLLADRMRQALARSRRTDELVAVCILDLDGFKQVNDSLGHQAGDQLLREVAQRLLECIRQEDTAARLGGDEFALLLSGLQKIGDCEQTLARIVGAVANPYQVAGQSARVSASIGVTLFPNDGSAPDLLLRHADHSMYEAKQAGKNRYRFFDPSHDQRQHANQNTLNKIAKALGAGQFALYYQPKVDCRRGKVVGAEALVRWKHPILGLLGPSEFIPLLEHDDLIVDLGEWVIQEALRQLREWLADGIDIKISVNISARQLHRKEFTQRLHELLASHGSDAIGRLEVEIVETAALEDVNAVADAIRACQAMGISVALDDFGTGFSSLVHLKRLAADVLKIDQSFVSGMLDDPGDLAIVEGVIGLAASFRRKVIAEGVETIDHVFMLMGLGCHVMQGYALARPMPAERMSAWLKTFVPDPLWRLTSSSRPSRDYFELLLAEANHRHWIEQVVAYHAKPREDTDPASLLDHRRCRFGRWYYREGMRRFRNFSDFRAIDAVHRSIHESAARLSEYQRTGRESEARAEESHLLAQQTDMIGLLRRLRIVLADELLGKHPD